MKSKKQQGLNFEIDRLTNSIENIITGDSFQTEVSLFTIEDAKICTKKNGWNFDWKFELKQPTRDVFKLTIASSISAIQGLISLEVKMHLSIKENQKFTLVWRAILLPMRVNCLFKGGTRGMFHLLQRHN